MSVPKRKRKRTGGERFALATGSLPVSSAKLLYRRWGKRVKLYQRFEAEWEHRNKRHAATYRGLAREIMECIQDLCACTGRQILRQPEENTQVTDAPRSV